MSEEYICSECGYKWKSRRADFGKPAFCPRCHSRQVKIPNSGISNGFKGLFNVGKLVFGNNEQKIKATHTMMKASGTCNYCGKDVGKEGGYEGQCIGGFLGCDKFLCKRCAKVCKRCGKIFCPEHMKKHQC